MSTNTGAAYDADARTEVLDSINVRFLKPYESVDYFNNAALSAIQALFHEHVEQIIFMAGYTLFHYEGGPQFMGKVTHRSALASPMLRDVSTMQQNLVHMYMSQRAMYYTVKYFETVQENATSPQRAQELEEELQKMASAYEYYGDMINATEQLINSDLLV